MNDAVDKSAQSQLIFNDGRMKGRLIKKDKDWYVGEFKTAEMETWMPWICGTSEYLWLTEQEKAWAK